MQHKKITSIWLRFISLIIVCSLNAPLGMAQTSAEANECLESRRFTFSWSLENACSNSAPRGGTSKGAPLVLDPQAHSGWLSLLEEGLSDHEKDRRAILAMAGPYRTSFEFIEIVGYTSRFEPDRPYQSWGTEYIYVVDEKQDFISLQHIMVMFVDMGDEGGIVGPIVQKHWRQDWQFEKSDLLAFEGNNTWAHQRFTEDQVAGTWAQSVFQVDDSPRYEAFGKWEHKANFSSWLSEETWRPVPRRETSIRDDYQVLEGTNRHTIVPNGWVHEEQNYKVQLDENGNIASTAPYISKELGVNRYERIIDFDFTAGDEYWSETGPYWSDVRKVWDELIASADRHGINPSFEGVPLFGAMFQHAETYSNVESYDSDEVKEVVRETLSNYFQ